MEDLTADEYELIKDMFKVLDRDNEGCFTSRELALFLCSLGRNPTDNEVQAMINEVDSDGNGTIEIEEFGNLILHKMRDTIRENELRDAFRVFDRDNQGYLSTTELKNVFTSLSIKVGDDELEDMIREYDLDQDNHISFEEFVNMMTMR